MTEQEEKDLREKLEKELPNGWYDIGTGDFHCYTGKGGKIDFEVALRKDIQEKYKVDFNVIPQTAIAPSTEYSTLTKEKLEQVIKDITFNHE